MTEGHDFAAFAESVGEDLLANLKASMADEEAAEERRLERLTAFHPPTKEELRTDSTEAFAAFAESLADDLLANLTASMADEDAAEQRRLDRLRAFHPPTQEELQASRSDYTDDQPRDGSGRWTSGGSSGARGPAKSPRDVGGSSAGASSKAPPSAGRARAPRLSKSQAEDLAEKLYSYGEDKGGDWDHYQDPARLGVVSRVRDIVESTTKAEAKYDVGEVAIRPLYGAKGTFTPEHFGETREGDTVPGRITVTPEQHAAAIGCALALSEGRKPTDTEVSGLHTYVHEVTHTTSPMYLSSGGYEGYGAVLEEMTNEVAARAVTESMNPKLLGDSKMLRMVGGQGSYQGLIDQTVDLVAHETHAAGGAVMRDEKAASLLRQAAIEYRRHAPEKPMMRAEALRDFALVTARVVGNAPNVAPKGARLDEVKLTMGLEARMRHWDERIFDPHASAGAERHDAGEPEAGSVFQLRRNDVDAALAFIRARGGRVSTDEMHVILMLQDDPSELLDALDSAGDIRTDFEDDQPRDEGGRWTAGGGGGAAAASKGSTKAPTGPRLNVSKQVMSLGHQAGRRAYEATKDMNDEEAGRAREDVLKQMLADQHISPLLHMQTTFDWRQDPDSERAVRLSAACQLLGATGADDPNASDYNAIERTRKEMEAGKHAETVRYAQHLYAFTQGYLGAAGVQEVVVFRGLHGGPAEQVAFLAGRDADVSVQARPLSCWSDQQKTAETYAFYQAADLQGRTFTERQDAGAILSMRVPREHIFFVDAFMPGDQVGEYRILSADKLKARVIEGREAPAEDEESSEDEE